MMASSWHDKKLGKCAGLVEHMETKWAAALQGEKALQRTETLEYFSEVKAHLTDSATVEKFEKLQSASLCDLGLSDDQIPLRLASCQNLVHLDLSSNNLVSIPKETFSLLSLKYANFCLNSIQVIPSNIKLLTHLEKVNLSYNEISNLSPVTACTNLQMLWIAGNRLSDIPTDIRNLSELMDVDLSDNMITDLIPVLGCKKLTVLKSNHNKLEGLNAGLATLGELKELDLSHNKVTDITPVVECAKLQILKANDNQLNGLPAELVKLSELKKLDLSHNKVTDITPAVECKKLLELRANRNKLVGLPIGLRKLGELRNLDLSSNEIADITPIVGCTKLEELLMNRNKVVSLPAKLRDLCELKELDLSHNKVIDIAHVVECAKLQSLRVNHNKLECIPNGMSKLGELRSLDLSHNKITQITPVVECSKLQVLKVKYLKLEDLPTGLKKLNELKDLDLSYNEISDIAPVIECANLQVLKVKSNDLLELPTSLGKLSELKKLDLSFNEITDISPVVECAKLQVLKLKSNELADLPTGLGNLNDLKHIDLSNNKITDIAAAADCTKLHVLKVNRNNLKNVPSDLGELGELKDVYLSGNKISDITAVVGCTKLKRLNVSHNKLVTIPTGMRKLGELQYIDLSFNEIGDLNSLCECTNLIELHCSTNKISRLPEELGQLHKLEVFDIRDNEINQLPLYFDLCDSLTDIKCSGNPLTRPPLEVCSCGPKVVFQYFKDLRETECSLRKQQVVLLGETGAGKTSLALTLKDGRSSLTDSSDRTHVLQKYIWVVKDFLKLHITDFGGHQIYELAHTFFLCSEVIALLTVDLYQYTSDKYHDLVGRWVNSILFMSPKSTLMVVCTHSDCCSKESIRKSRKDILDQIRNQQTRFADYVQSQLSNIEVKLQTAIEDESDELQSYSRYLEDIYAAKSRELQCLRSNFIQFEHVFVVSSGASMSGISDLRRALIRCCEQKAVTLPGSWLSIEDRMNAEDVKAKLYISYGEFCNIVRRGLSNIGFQADQAYKTAEALLSYQHRCGGFLWFKDDSRLKQCVFHRPEMIVNFLKSVFHHDMDTLLDHTNSVFGACFTKIIFETEKENLLQYGRISSKLLRCLVKRFVTDEGMSRTMIHLLEKFSLCFTVSENDGARCLLFPWFLSNDEPPALKEEKWLAPSPNEYLYEVKFNFPVQCPTGFFERAVVILHQQFTHFEELAQDVIVWKNGVYLHDDDDKVLLTRRPDGGDISVALSVRGHNVTTLWSQFEDAYNELVNLLKQWPGAPCDMLYMCPHCLISSQKSPSWFPANKLLHPRRKLGKYLPCKNSIDKKVPVDVVIPRGVIGALYESPVPKRRDVVAVDRIHSEKVSTSALGQDSEVLCQRGKDTVSGHFMRSLTQAFSSVAKVTWSNGISGSGFRVGSRYLMTNYHVVREDAALTQDEERRRQNTRLCLFHFDRPYQYGDEASMRSVHLAPNSVAIYDRALDYAVLELLVEPNSQLPQALTKFTKLGRHEKIHIAGHPDGQAKVVDMLCSVVHHPLAGQDEALYHASEKMTFGSSGSPGLVGDAEDNARVAVVHSGRYNHLVPPGPQTYGVEHGIRMEAIYHHLNSNNETLCNDVFPEGEPQ